MEYSIYLLVFSLFIVSCSTTSYISPKEDLNNGVGKFFSKGKEIGLSVEDSTTVAFYGERKNREITLFVFLKNGSGKYLNVIPDNVKVYGIEENGQLEQLHTYNPRKYLKRMRNQQTLALTLTAMGNVFEDLDAGTSTTTAYGTAYGSDGTSYNFYGTATTTDESERREAQRQSQQELMLQARQAKLYRNSVKDGMLLKTTLFPDSYIGGNIIVKFKSFDKYLLRVPVGKEVHEIGFRLVKI